MTRKEIRDQVVQWFGLQQIEDWDEATLVNDLIYQGTIDLLARTRCVVRCMHLRTQPNVANYVLDHGILSLVDVDDGATRRRRRDDSSPGFTLIRSDLLKVKPTPSAQTTLEVWGVMRPQKMDDDADSPGMEAYGAIPDEFQDAIVLYCFWKASDYADDSRSSDGDRYRLLYEGNDTRGGRLREIRAMINKRGTARAPDRHVTLSSTSDRSIWVG